jgi:hypothetical protein
VPCSLFEGETRGGAPFKRLLGAIEGFGNLNPRSLVPFGSATVCIPLQSNVISVDFIKKGILSV